MKVRTSRLPPERVAWGFAESPAGKLAVGLTGKGEICRVAFLRGRKATGPIADWRKEWPKTEFYRGPELKSLADRPILLAGTPFQCAVWRAIAGIPFGRTRTYGDIARRIGKGSAVRAVGQACGANPVPFFVPCHRVVAANGLGGFSGGLEIKKGLLRMEGKKAGK
jgi:O-6-methylguanine DNA methyltransferase